VRSLVVGGATLPPGLAQRCLRVFPEAECRVVYGSTEAEPIADVPMTELVLHGRDGRGHLLGCAAPMAEVCIVAPGAPLDDEAAVARARVAPGESGEILVAGPHVLRAYVDNPAATRDSKVARADGLVWHRTGDVGHIDRRGRLWLEGRLKDAVRVGDAERHTLALEKALDALPGIERSALVAAPDGSPALVLCGAVPDVAELRRCLSAEGFSGVRCYRADRLPVDGRHNSKIDRPALREQIAHGRLIPLGDL
jgi:acyl-CoA synthetase (AMP-forming)/AMP-acid ligase II